MHAFSTPIRQSIPRHAVVSTWSVVNTTLDSVFYDVGSLSAEERAELSADTAPEGSVLVVHPREASRQILAQHPWDFVQSQLDNGADQPVDAIVVAGVGSSDLGTACLARNVADYLHRPVAGIVSGFGLADVLTEALGGWFVLGAGNAMRDYLARIFDAYELKDHVRDPESHRHLKASFEAVNVDPRHFVYGSPDSTTLLFLLLRLGGGIKWLVGHSKGNYSIENALEGWVSACHSMHLPLPSDLRIVTLGAVIRFPVDFTHLYQFIGQVDVFGMLNSRPALAHETVPGAWHSLNPTLPGHVSVEAALRKAKELSTAG